MFVNLLYLKIWLVYNIWGCGLNLLFKCIVKNIIYIVFDVFLGCGMVFLMINFLDNYLFKKDLD